jgi:hypothetical protein
MTLFTKEIQWYVYSFINEPTGQKKIFTKKVLTQLNQYFLKKTIVVQLTPGSRLVCTNFGEPCLNCYHYGINKPCMNHSEETPDTWITFSYYKTQTSLVNNLDETWDEYNIKTIEERRIKQERYNQYMSIVQLHLTARHQL